MSGSSDPEIAAAIKRFPEEFGLKAFPGDVFCIEPSACYRAFGAVTLYVYIKTADGWLAFCKGTESELQAQIRKL